MQSVRRLSLLRFPTLIAAFLARGRSAQNIRHHNRVCRRSWPQGSGGAVSEGLRNVTTTFFHRVRNPIMFLGRTRGGWTHTDSTGPIPRADLDMFAVTPVP
jgi:hypothetical protein